MHAAALRGKRPGNGLRKEEPHARARASSSFPSQIVRSPRRAIWMWSLRDSHDLSTPKCAGTWFCLRSNSGSVANFDFAGKIRACIGGTLEHNLGASAGVGAPYRLEIIVKPGCIEITSVCSLTQRPECRELTSQSGASLSPTRAPLYRRAHLVPMTLSFQPTKEHCNFRYLHSRNGDGIIFAL
jgi:hypothetical protein